MTRTRCAWAGADPLMQAYHDEEWGVPERDRPRAVGKAGARRLPGRPRLDHRAAQARGLPRRLRRLRPRRGRPLRRGRRRAPARRPRHHPLARQDRGHHRRRPHLLRHGRRAARTSPPTAGPSPTARSLRGDGVSVPASTALSERVSKELKRRGFKFVGPTIVYAWMQAVGIVNDHAADCFRRDAA